MEQTEVWKNIKGFEGYFQVSSFGNVRSLNNDKNDIIKYQNDLRGEIGIRIKEGIRKGYYSQIRLNRLVAETFIPNPNNYKYVMNIDGNLHNNNIDNLKWVNYNQDDYTWNLVHQYSRRGKWAATYRNTWVASQQTGISQLSIFKNCVGETKMGGDYYWRFGERVDKLAWFL